ncbi:hypothetical protein [Thalassospira xiamenensis]|uniref:hypothetical protein n=1 Tax=Thalassospira xiamenensis TaxID=220697 RepID=UPI003AA92260
MATIPASNKIHVFKDFSQMVADNPPLAAGTCGISFPFQGKIELPHRIEFRSINNSRVVAVTNFATAVPDQDIYRVTEIIVEGEVGGDIGGRFVIAYQTPGTIREYAWYDYLLTELNDGLSKILKGDNISGAAYKICEFLRESEPNNAAKRLD